MLNTYIYHQSPPTCFSVCYGTYRETTALPAQKLCAVCSAVIQAVLQNVQYTLFFFKFTDVTCGPGSSVGIATDHGLDGQGPNPGGDEIFCPSRPALWPTQPPVKWVTGLSRGVKCGRGVLLTTYPL